jgi:hypothetical protein
MDMYSRVQPNEKRLRYGRYLGSVIHVQDDVAAPCPFHVREVRRLRVEFFEDRLDGLAKPSVFGQRVSLPMRNGLFGSPLRGVVSRGLVLAAPRLAAAPHPASSHQAEAPPEPRRFRPLSG